MHGLKKLMHKVVPPSKDESVKVDKDASIMDRANKLKLAKEALKPTQTQIKEVEKNWKTIFTSLETALANMNASYPEDDEVKQQAKLIAKEASDAQRASSSAQLNTQAKYTKAAENINAYVEQITKMDSEYKKLEDLRVDYEMYLGKVHGLEGKAEKKGHDEKAGDKISRNHEKLDSAKKLYEDKIAFVSDRQGELLAQQEDAFRVAYSAFFFAHALMLDSMDKAFEGSYEYAQKKEADVLAFRFTEIKV